MARRAKDDANLGPKKAEEKAVKRAPNTPSDDAPPSEPSAEPMQLETPKHGKGLLRRSGVSPGSGRRPSALRAIAMNGVDRALPQIQALAEAGGPDAIPAFNALVKVAGLDGRISPADVRERLRAQVEMIRSRSQWTPQELLDQLGEIWR